MVDQTTCGYRHVLKAGGVSAPCGNPVQYLFWLKTTRPRNPAATPGRTCSEHAIILRRWSFLETIWSAS